MEDKVFSFRVLKPGAALPWPRVAEVAPAEPPRFEPPGPEEYRDFAASMIGQCAAAGDPLHNDRPMKRHTTRDAAMVVAKALRVGVADAERLIAEMLIDGELEEYRDKRGMRLRLPVDGTHKHC